jgi:general secretion pathway protein I
MAPTPAPVSARDGYSLMEAIVALFVLAVASTGLLVALQAHIDGVRGLEDRVVAQWVAENRLAELAIGEPESAAVTMMGVAWVVASRRAATDDPDLQSVEVTVTRTGAASPSSRLSGFVDAGATS